jgi:hypothetical protein
VQGKHKKQNMAKTQTQKVVGVKPPLATKNNLLQSPLYRMPSSKNFFEDTVNATKEFNNLG